MQIDDFISINFVNKNVQQMRKNMSYRELKHLYNCFYENQIYKNILENENRLDKVCQKAQFRKVANQVQFLGYDKDLCLIFAIYAPLIQKKYLSFLKVTIEKIIQESCFRSKNKQNSQKTQNNLQNNGVSLIFFNNLTNKRYYTKSNKKIVQPLKIDDFKDQVIKNLQFRHLSRINQILLVYPSFINKSWGFLNSFGLQNGFYSRFYINCDSIYELITLLGPLFQYQKVQNNFFSKPELQLNKTKIFSQQQIAQSKSQLSFHQQFYPQQNHRANDGFFAYHKKLQDYLRHPSKNIPLILAICYQQIQSNYINFEGLFRKVANQNDLRKLQNRILSYEHDTFNKNLQHNQSLQLMQKIRSQLKLFGPQTITSFIKNIFTELQQPIFPFQVYQRIVNSSWSDIQFNINNYRSEVVKNTQQKNKNISVSLSPDIFSLSNVENNVKQKVAYFQKLTQNQSSVIYHSTKTYLNDSLIAKNQNLMKTTNIKFRKIPNSNHTINHQNEKLKNNDFLSLKELKNNCDPKFNLLLQTIKLLHKVSKRQSYNLMSPKNLAICFNPCFFRICAQQNQLKKSSVQELYEGQNKLVWIISKMIEKPQQFFQLN